MKREPGANPGQTRCCEPCIIFGYDSMPLGRIEKGEWEIKRKSNFQLSNSINTGKAFQK